MKEKTMAVVEDFGNCPDCGAELEVHCSSCNAVYCEWCEYGNMSAPVAAPVVPVAPLVDPLAARKAEDERLAFLSELYDGQDPDDPYFTV